MEIEKAEWQTNENCVRQTAVFTNKRSWLGVNLKRMAVWRKKTRPPKRVASY